MSHEQLEIEQLRAQVANLRQTLQNVRCPDPHKCGPWQAGEECVTCWEVDMGLHHTDPETSRLELKERIMGAVIRDPEDPESWITVELRTHPGHAWVTMRWAEKQRWGAGEVQAHLEGEVRKLAKEHGLAILRMGPMDEDLVFRTWDLPFVLTNPTAHEPEGGA